MRRLIVPVTCLLVMLLYACEKYVIKPPEIEAGVSFSTQIQPFFDSKCVSCHGGSRAPDLRSEFAYDELVDGGFLNTGDPESSELYTTLTGSHKSRATDEEKLIILTWITEGALNN